MSHENMYICESQMQEKLSDAHVRRVEKQRRPRARAAETTTSVSVVGGVIARVSKTEASRSDEPVVIAEGAELLESLTAAERHELLFKNCDPSPEAEGGSS